MGGWSPLNADRTETAILPYLIRAYPKATAGKINSFSFNPVTKIFSISFKNSAAITQPTEIFVPNRFYPKGFNLIVNGTTNFTQSFDVVKQVLKIKVNEPKEVEIIITAK